MKRRSFVSLAAAGVFAILPCALPSQALAQSASEWPAKPVRIITPFPASAGPEVIVRVLAEKLTRSWGTQVIVENRPGGNGFIAITAFKQGDKNGYDLIQLDNVHLTAYPHLFKKLPYDPKADFELLLPLFKASFFFVVPTGSPYKSVGDIIADAKAKPGKLNYGSWSIGNPVHLASELFESMTGTQIQHVVYKETSQLYSDVASGELAFALGTYGTTQAPARRPSAVSRRRRRQAPGCLSRRADCARIRRPRRASRRSAGLRWPRREASLPQWRRRSVAISTKALAEPDIAQRYATFGYELFSVTKEQLDAHMAGESARFADVIRKAKISFE